MHWRRKWQPAPVFLPGESQGRGSLEGCPLWGRTESDTTEATQLQQQQQCSKLASTTDALPRPFLLGPCIHSQLLQTSAANGSQAPSSLELLLANSIHLSWKLPLSLHSEDPIDKN